MMRERPNIYADGERPERCANCVHCSVAELHTFNGEVWYEWWVCGDYCSECGELLANAITRSIQMPERCSKAFRDKDARVKAEVEMIEEQRERTW